MLKSALAAVLAIVASASQADETTTTDVPHVDAIQLTFRAMDPQRVLIKEATILSELSQQMTTSTKFPLRSARETSDAVIDTGGRTQIDTARHVLTVQYLAHSRYLSGGFTGTTLSIPISYTVERNDETVKITLAFPDQGTVERHGMPLLTRKLWDMHQILDDYSALVAKLPSAELHFNYQATGELESKYKPDAVLGSLERMLSRPVRGSMPMTQVSGSGSVTRDENFVCTINGARREVQVSTFPYHDGTKVSYVATLPFTLRADGSMSGGEEASAMNALLAKVAND